MDGFCGFVGGGCGTYNDAYHDALPRPDMSAKTMQDALRPINEALLRHDKDHAAHYATGNTVLRIAQQLTDHEKHDDDRFDQMLSMQEEIRDDIKTLLKR